MVSSATALIAAGDSDFYLITFTEDVLLSGTLAANTTGDPDFFIDNEAGTAGYAAAVDGDEVWSDVLLPADVYLIEVLIWSDGGEEGSGYTLSLSTTAP